MSKDLINLLERLSSLIKQETRESGIRLGLQPVQFEALVYLSLCNRYSDTPIAVTEYLGLTKGTVSQTLKLLEKNGLIQKAKDEKDKRLIHLKLTAMGKRLVSENSPPRQLANVLDNQPKSVQAVMTSLLTQLLSEYQASSGNQGFGLCRNCRYNRSTENGFRCALTSEPLALEETQLICREYLGSV